MIKKKAIGTVHCKEHSFSYKIQRLIIIRSTPLYATSLRYSLILSSRLQEPHPQSPYLEAVASVFINHVMRTANLSASHLILFHALFV